MGYKYTDAAFKLTQEEAGEIRYIDKYLLLTLASHADNKTGLCYPGYTLLSEETYLSRSQVSKCLEVLKRAGLVSVVETSRTKATTYKLHLDIVGDNGRIIKGRKIVDKQQDKAFLSDEPEHAFTLEGYDPDEDTFDEPTFNLEGDDEDL
ncbi:MAG TPA: helix-turn-helix domain-containing protein [Terracidiphilus sp.]|jgi:hypothetical protein|nr:helix-turn-helix domain-containing protein [Terracidiphilus sp.]